MTHHRIALAVSCSLVGALLVWRALDVAPPGKQHPTLTPTTTPIVKLELTQVAPAPAPMPTEKLKVAFSPYAIKRYFDRQDRDTTLDLNPLWNRLHINAEMKLEMEVAPFDHCRGCQGNLFRLDLGSPVGEVVMLQIAAKGEDGTRILIFKLAEQAKPRWRLLGYVDDLARWVKPEHRVVAGANKRWLVLTVQTGHGSGYGEYYDRWYEVSQKGIREVLSFPAEIYEGGFGHLPERDLDSRFLSHTVETNGTDVINVKFTDTWRASSIGKHGRILSRSIVTVAYVKKPNASVFSFDPKRSSVSRKKLKALLAGK